jgi:hypothetical protein
MSTHLPVRILRFPVTSAQPPLPQASSCFKSETNQLKLTATVVPRDGNLFSSDEVAFKKSNRYADLDMYNALLCDKQVQRRSLNSPHYSAQF